MFKNIFFLTVSTIVFTVHANPKGYFRTEKGALVRGEVLYADNAFYYYRRASDPDKICTVKVEDVPNSFRRIVDSLRLKGEITAPPDSIVEREVAEQTERSYGKWQVEKLEKNAPCWLFAVLDTKDSKEQTVSLVVRYSYNGYNNRRSFDVLLVFDNNIIMTRNCEVTYQFDDDEQIVERWNQGLRDHKTLHSPEPFKVRDKLLESDYVSFAINAKTNDERCFGFSVSHFDRVYEDVFEPVVDNYEP